MPEPIIEPTTRAVASIRPMPRRAAPRRRGRSLPPPAAAPRREESDERVRRRRRGRPRRRPAASGGAVAAGRRRRNARPIGRRRRPAPRELEVEALLAPPHRPAVVGLEKRTEDRRERAQQRLLRPHPPVVGHERPGARLLERPDACCQRGRPGPRARIRADAATRRRESSQSSVYGSHPFVCSGRAGRPRPRRPPRARRRSR